jgi:alpha-glucosidase
MEFPWWQRGIIYQIYPRSFADSNGDGIGDLNGITQHLDYLAELGVDAIWLSPFYPSPDVDFGYDVSDYCAVDPKFGALEDFDHLVHEAHRRGIHVILDLVLNHTSDQHPWFIESKSSRDNPKRDWYLWRDPAPGGQPPNNWQAVFGGSGWELDPTTGQYYFHMFYKGQPDLNWHNPAVRQAIMDVFRFWLDRGVDGFRLDVFNVYFKHPEFLDNPSSWFRLPGYAFASQKHINDCDQPEMVPLVQEIRALLESYSKPGQERYVVGETFLSDAQKAALYCGPDRLNAAFNFEMLSCSWNARSFMNAVMRWEHLLGTETWPNYVLNNHDVIRSATRFHSLISNPQFSAFPVGDVEDDARLKVAAALLLTLRGTPFIYYGEEIGMRDIPIHSKEEVLDPIGKRFWPLIKGRDGCRSPMQWDHSAHAGFSAAQAKPWLPVHPNAQRRNVLAQKAQPQSLWNFYRQLIALRRDMTALIEGTFQPLVADSRSLAVYCRESAGQQVMVLLNFSSRFQHCTLPAGQSGQLWQCLLSTHRDSSFRLETDAVELHPNEALILKRTPQE